MTHKRSYRKLWIALGFFAAFVLWTIAVKTIDLSPIGPQDSVVGFAALNGFFHRLAGVHMTLYVITDWLGLVPVAFGFGFALLGLVQWIKRKNILKVDRSILALGGFYLVVVAVYLFFEEFVVNYRPVLIEGYLEASYPSSTTMLAMCVMPTAMMQLGSRIKNQVFRRCVLLAMAAFTVFMVIARLVSGVHWLTDIVGGVLISVALIALYDALDK